ncbi:MAG TPA: lipopolysaccharide assembly protein LapA domain-containing protein [Streptosporangiaceae bacterium]
MSQQVEAKQAGRRIGGGAIAVLTGLAVLIIFVIQNREDVRFHFLTVNFVWPLWLYTIVIAVFGALVWFGLGVMRRHRRRKERRENRRY